MDPIVATYTMKVTVRAPEGSAFEAPKLVELEAAVESGVEVLAHASLDSEGVTVNASAERTDV